MQEPASNSSVPHQLAARFGLWRLLYRGYFFLRWLPAQLKAVWSGRPTVQLTTRLGDFTALPLTRTVTESSPAFQAHLHHWVTAAPAGIFIDIGAGSGLFSHLALQEGSARAAFAFEPNPAVYALLAKNVADNDLAATAINAAVGSRSGKLTLTPHSVETGGTSTCGGGSGVSVAATALDTFLTEQEMDPAEISAIRISLRGHELSALQGMPQTLEKMPAGARLWVDIWSESTARATLLSFITQTGFTLAERAGSQHLFVKS